MRLGVAVLCAAAWRGVSLALYTASWRLLIPPPGRPGFRALLRLRWIGEAVNTLVPTAQVGGDLARAQLLAARATPRPAAGAAMVGDLALGTITEVLFAGAGAAAWLVLAGGRRFGAPIAAGVVLVALAGVVLLLVLRGGLSALVTRLPRALRQRLESVAGGVDAVDQAMRALASRRRLLARAAAWHLVGWFSHVVETWSALALLGFGTSWAAALAIESLSAVARAGAFFVPGGMGVQEVALVALAHGLGVPLPGALALAAVKRGREVAVGLPGLGAWAAAERTPLRRLVARLRGRRGRASSARGPEPGGEGPLRVAVLVDLALRPDAGGHVKAWERLAAAAVGVSGLDLTIHFAGPAPGLQVVGDNVRYRLHPPAFSSARLRFLAQVPDHTDLAPHHRGLAQALAGTDLVHTTDAYFAFARTAERVTRRWGMPLTSSVHTDMPRYTRLFATATIHRLTGHGRTARLLNDGLGLPARAEARMQRRLVGHLRRCRAALVSRPEELARVARLLPPEGLGLLRRGIDRALFSPFRRDRLRLESELRLPPGRLLVLFVGRLDRGKNVLVLARAAAALVAAGFPLHLVCAGDGPDRRAVEASLGPAVTCVGHLAPAALARLYASVDVVAHPSEIEERSNVIAEAMSSGRAVLARPAVARGLFTDGEDGMVVPGPEAASWARALAQLSAEPVLRARLGAAARRRAETALPTWREVLEQDLLPVWRRSARAELCG